MGKIILLLLLLFFGPGRLVCPGSTVSGTEQTDPYVISGSEKEDWGEMLTGEVDM